ncbi:MAG: HDOD domain-containing protein [Acidobacteria bacterium]|nr:HDOD domain-containing protein [Acidobacteriota bacterium]
MSEPAVRPGTGGGMANHDPNQAKRVELILQQVDSLPTLSAVAVRLLELTTADDTSAKEVIELVASDPALSSKVIKLCRCHPRGRTSMVSSVDRAVVLLGFDALRSAVLSVQVFELFDQMHSPGGEVPAQEPVFDREMFWHHSLGVAVACELIVEASPLREKIGRGDAYLSGLLHDLGQLALHVILPKSFDRVCELAEGHAVSVDHACRHIIGIDSHSAGKRIAEHWHLTHALMDVLWLSGQPFTSLPDLRHRELIGLVSLADAVVRRQHMTTVGHGPRGEDIAEMCEQLGLSAGIIEDLLPRLHEQVSARASTLGLSEEHAPEVFLRLLSRANEVLGRLNVTVRQQAAVAEAQAGTLGGIAEFHASAMPSGSVVGVLGKVVRSAASTLGEGFFAMLYQDRVGQPWQMFQFACDGRVLRSDLINPPFASTAVEDLGDDVQVSMQALGVLPWLADYLGGAAHLRDVRLLPLRCGWGVSAVLLHECPIEDRTGRQQLEALSRTWGAAIAAAAQHRGAKLLGEDLAEANRVLSETQQALARSTALAAVGEIAAGAAHEMNNPLTVISGRSQLLASRLVDSEHRAMAEQIVAESHRLSDIITALRSFADPAEPARRDVDLAELIMRVAQQVGTGDRSKAQINTIMAKSLPTVHIDPDQIGRALNEMLRNAVESEGSKHIELRVQIDPLDDRLKIQIVDDGAGLSEHALAHAFDPFFSAKPAGRQPGLGLAHARRLVEAHDGRITLENGPTGGAVATLWLSKWRGEAQERREVA